MNEVFNYMDNDDGNSETKSIYSAILTCLIAVTVITKAKGRMLVTGLTGLSMSNCNTIII